MNFKKLLAIIFLCAMLQIVGWCQMASSPSTNQVQKVTSEFTMYNGEAVTVTTAAVVCVRSEPLHQGGQRFVVPGISVVTQAMVCGNSQVQAKPCDQSGQTHVWQRERQPDVVVNVNNYPQAQPAQVLEPAPVVYYEEPSQVYYYGSPIAALSFSAGIQFGGGYYPPYYWEYGNSYNEYSHIRNTEYLYGINRGRSYYHGGSYGSYGYGVQRFPPVITQSQMYYGGGGRQGYPAVIRQGQYGSGRHR